MKLYQFALLALIVLMPTSTMALPPPIEKKTLSERVALATHVVVAVGKKVSVVRTENGVTKTVTPTPAKLDLYTGAEIELEVKEVLFPKGFNPKGPITYRFSGGIFGVDQIQRDVASGPHIYLLGQFTDGGRTLYGPSYGWHLFEAMTSLDELKTLLRARSNAKLPAEQDAAGQPATRPESKPKGDQKPQPESEERPR